MNVAIGSTNAAKVKALDKLSKKMGFSVIVHAVPSRVPEQPRSDEETMQGALHRARGALKAAASDVGIGLEGGISSIGERWFVCNWGALVDKTGYECVSSGGHFMLPETFLAELERGKELGELVKAQNQHAGKNAGAISMATDGFVTRQMVYEQLLAVLFGQYFHYRKSL